MTKNAMLREGLEALAEALRCRRARLSRSLDLCDQMAAEIADAGEQELALVEGGWIAAALRANANRLSVLEDAIGVLEDLDHEGAAGN